MYLDINNTSKDFLDKVQTLGNKLKYFISGTNPIDEQAKTAIQAKQALELAKREVELAKRELARAEREAKY
jgi:hypothetical protein